MPQRRLFVDVDDTLLRWYGGRAPHPFGAGATGCEPNQDVIDAIGRWRHKNPDGMLIIWSGGGADYAKTWARRLLPHERWSAEAKHNPLVDPANDVFIDDAPFEAWAHAAIAPLVINGWDPA